MPAAPPSSGKVDPAVAAAAAAAKNAAAGAGAGAVGKKRWRPIGAGLFESVSPVYMVILLATMYAYGHVSSRPLHHLIGSEISVEVDQVVDGDTFVGKTQSGQLVRFRLRQIDAPERDQPFGNQATHKLSQLLLDNHENKDVVVFLWEQDDWGRYVVDCVTREGIYTKVVFVQEELVKAGFAWTFGSFGRADQKNTLSLAMEKAREEKVGLWRQKDPVEPWRHRYMQRQTKGRGDSWLPGDSKRRSRKGKGPGNKIGDEDDPVDYNHRHQYSRRERKQSFNHKRQGKAAAR